MPKGYHGYPFRGAGYHGCLVTTVTRSQLLPRVPDPVPVVTSLPDENTMSTLSRLQRAGWSVALVHLGGTGFGNTNSPIPTYAVPETTEWESLEEILIQ